MKTLKIFVLFFALSLTTNIVNAFSVDDKLSVIWRFAEKHEYGDLEPSKFCYISMKDNILLMHWKTPGDTETVGVYTINKKEKSSFCATKTVTYEPDDSKENSFIVSKSEDLTAYGANICGTMADNKLTIKQVTTANNKQTMRDWITLRKEEALIQNAFPEQILKKHFNWISPW